MSSERTTSVDIIRCPPGADVSAILDHPADDVGLLVVTVDRSEAEASAWLGQKRVLAQLCATRSRVERWRGRVELTFTGYDDDPRELFEVPEARVCLLDLTRAWPAFHFLSTEGTVRWTVLYAHAALKVVIREPNSEGKVQFSIDPGGLRDYLRAQFDLLRLLERAHDLGEDETRAQAARSVSFHLINGTWSELLAACAPGDFPEVFPAAA